MNIQHLKVSNYRNLDGISIHFHNQANFIVGENNIGKTNILDLLHIIFNRRGFSQADFRDQDEEIRVEIKIGLNKGEIGIFDDYFSLEEEQDSIELCVVQETIDDNIRLYEKNTGDELFKKHIGKAHFVSYGSVRNPDKELNFDTNKSFLNKIIERNLEDKDYLNMDAIEILVNNLNQIITKIETFKLFNIEAKADNDITSLLGRIIQLQAEDEFEIKELGEGVQFLNSIPLVLLNQIAQILDKINNDSVITIGDEKVLYLIISIDEPELHLHPHSQRFFINYLTEIISGNNPGFNGLLKLIFGLDRIQGQLITVTHSPYVLMDDYKQITRIYKDVDIIAKSGIKSQIDLALNNHLYRYFDKFKEALYAKKVLVVEGVTELGAMDSFYKKEEIKVGFEGISTVNANGADNVPIVMKLFTELGIPTVGMIDRDEGNLAKPTFRDVNNIFQTELKEFENDIVEYLDFDLYINYLEEKDLDIVNHTIESVKQSGCEYNHPGDKDAYIESLRALDPKLKQEIYELQKAKIVKHLVDSKNYITGNLIAELASETPKSFKKAIECLVDKNE